LSSPLVVEILTTMLLPVVVVVDVIMEVVEVVEE
jgi:hypothetical protein